MVACLPRPTLMARDLSVLSLNAPLLHAFPHRAQGRRGRLDVAVPVPGSRAFRRKQPDQCRRRNNQVRAVNLCANTPVCCLFDYVSFRAPCSSFTLVRFTPSLRSSSSFTLVFLRLGAAHLSLHLWLSCVACCCGCVSRRPCLFGIVVLVRVLLRALF